MMNVLPWIIRDAKKFRDHKPDAELIIDCSLNVFERVIKEHRRKKFPNESEQEMIGKLAISFLLCSGGGMAYHCEGIRFRLDKNVQYYELREELPK